MRKKSTRKEPIGPLEFHLLVRAGRVREAIARLGRELFARTFNAIRRLFPAFDNERVSAVVFRAVRRLEECAHRVQPHHDLERWLFLLAYDVALGMQGPELQA